MSKLLCRVKNNASTLQTKAQHGDDAEEDKQCKSIQQEVSDGNIYETILVV
jgi:hypothetical protein